MATTGIINGTLMALYVNGTKVAVLSTNSVPKSWPTRDTANKDSGSWMTKLPTRGNWSMTGTAFFQFVASGGYKTLSDAMDAKQLVQVKMSTLVSGDSYWHGEGYITDLTADFPDDDASTYSITIEGSGQLYFTTLT